MIATKKYFVLLALVSIVFSSCKKETIDGNGNKPRRNEFSTWLSKSATQYDGYILYTAKCESWTDTNNTVHKSVNYYGTANFYDYPLTQGLNVGNVNIGSIVLPADSIRYGRMTYAYTIANVNDSANTTQFGNNTSFQVAGGSGYANINVNMYLPKLIYLVPEANNFATPVILKSFLPKSIFWYNDGRNQEGVVMMVEYNGFRSNFKDPALSGTSFFNNPVRVNDTGSSDITEAMLVGIPSGAIITLHVGRASEKIVTDANGKVVVVSAMAYTSQDYIYQH
ncbi:MAG: hypothetical protein KBE91_11100 [Bacteroidia bacterium]|nr:hypothetical protein [Bacteroidia bacterium]MBP9690150.1 hypothetical protein [Bacteroidia bacterium]